MHRVREVLRLKHVCRLSNRKIARACGVDRDTVGMYLKRAEKAGLGWPLPEGLADSEIEARLQNLPLSETDDMALAGIISTQLVDRQFLSGFRLSTPLGGADDVKVVLGKGSSLGVQRCP